ncbi:MAG: S-layer homology domain-containing protein [Candidatus Faecalibacterium intestinavium]|uniref:S-layer homology domain-containing protein n=1 Tax=Candidatus Faecalibacterium intestinavium TaxID=2838580 RepID=A0A9E2KL25_9FIRM|nr:S-layer homology domain-containing protein [Candidatus Faecalibacterium intestinavium]
MKKRLLALLLAVCLLVPAFTLPAAAVSSNINMEIQTARMLGILSAEMSENLDAAVTRAEFAEMMVAASVYKDSLGEQSAVGTLFSDVTSETVGAQYIRVAVQQGWMSGYTDGTFRPNDPVTLEMACTSALKMLGYKTTDLSGPFPTAQLSKASELGLRDQITSVQGAAITRAEAAVLMYNTLTASTSSGQTYGSSLGLTVSDGEVDASSALRRNLDGPHIAAEGETLPFTPAAIYRNGQISSSSELNRNDVYYYSESLNAVWIFTNRAAGRITAVSPSASAPTSVTIAGQSYRIGSSSVAYRISALSGGGVGQVVTLLLGMDSEVVGIVTDEEVDQTYYGVVESSNRSLTVQDGADILQVVNILCTDGATRSFRINKNLNYPEGWLISVHATGEGETVQPVSGKSVSGFFDSNSLTLGEYKLADDVEILDTGTEGGGVVVRPERINGVTLSSGDVRYYALNEQGEISHLILDDVTGDIWTYGCLTAVSNRSDSSSDQSTIQPDAVLLKMVSGLATGSLLDDIWKGMTGNTGKILSLILKTIAGNTDGLVGTILSGIAGGAQYTYMVNGMPATATADIKYPVLAGGIAVRTEANGNVRAMAQLQPILVDGLGAAYATSGSKRYPLADDMQVYLWHMGVYYRTTLSSINAEDYYLTGWYDNFGCAAGGQVRILMALKKN